MSNHKDDAKEFLIAAQVRGFSTDQNIAAAQVHATLHLAEQQRISNLIAFVASIAQQVGDGATPNDLVMDRAGAAGEQIVKGLGL